VRLPRRNSLRNVTAPSISARLNLAARKAMARGSERARRRRTKPRHSCKLRLVRPCLSEFPACLSLERAHPTGLAWAGFERGFSGDGLCPSITRGGGCEAKAPSTPGVSLPRRRRSRRSGPAACRVRRPWRRTERNRAESIRTRQLQLAANVRRPRFRPYGALRVENSTWEPSSRIGQSLIGSARVFCKLRVAPPSNARQDRLLLRRRRHASHDSLNMLANNIPTPHPGYKMTASSRMYVSGNAPCRLGKPDPTSARHERVEVTPRNPAGQGQTRGLRPLGRGFFVVNGRSGPLHRNGSFLSPPGAHGAGRHPARRGAEPDVQSNMPSTLSRGRHQPARRSLDVVEFARPEA